MKKEGVKVEACKACADLCGVSDVLITLDIDVRYMGEALTAYIREGRHILSI